MVVSRTYADVPVDGLQMRTFIAAPRAPGPHPAVVFYSDIFQLTESTLRWCVRLAGYGFLVAAPEIYHRREPSGTVLGFDDAGKVRGQADADATPVPDFDADVAALVDWLSDRCPAVGAAGHCTGGHLAFRAAFDPRVRATVCWYPTGLHDGRLGSDRADSLERAGEIDGELLLIWGTLDPHTPADGRRTVRDGLESSGIGGYEWIEYEAEHAFGRDLGDRYDPAATDAAFAETVAMFRRALSA